MDQHYEAFVSAPHALKYAPGIVDFPAHPAATIKLTHYPELQNSRDRSEAPDKQLSKRCRGIPPPYPPRGPSVNKAGKRNMIALMSLPRWGPDMGKLSGAEVIATPDEAATKLAH